METSSSTATAAEPSRAVLIGVVAFALGFEALSLVLLGWAV